MKTKIMTVMLILVAALMVTGIVYGDDPLKGTGYTEAGGLGWQAQTSRQPVYITDGLRLSTGVGVGINGPTLSVNVSSNIMRIECCLPTTLKQSWCNFNADDPLCNN